MANIFNLISAFIFLYCSSSSFKNEDYFFGIVYALLGAFGLYLFLYNIIF